MAEFAKYAFNKSHAAAYAVVSYRTAYLKTYYPEEFMAATLNSYLGNLDKVPLYIDECKRMKIQILKPDINKSNTKFTVDNGKIRFGLGSVKNVGTAVVDAIVRNRKDKGEFKSFTDFCERIQEESVNKKCIESLIKSGAFDEFGLTRSTLLSSFETIIDTIQTEGKRAYLGQVSMFDLNEEEEIDNLKYTYNYQDEFSERELLSMEKEMLGIYISGHPLDKIRDEIQSQTNINTIQMKEMIDQIENGEKTLYKDGDIVKYAGIISSIKKKYTKNNTIMEFITVEDLYGSAEVIVFEKCYQNAINYLIEDNVILITGRISIKDDTSVTIVANSITELRKKKSNILTLEITGIDEERKARLRGAIRFFSGDRNNLLVQIKDGENIKPCGGILLNGDTIAQFKEILGENRVII